MPRGGKLSKGKNAIRQMHSEVDSIADELHDIRTNDSPSSFSRAVVEDVILNPEVLTEDRINEIRSRVKNPSIARIIPRNSILARVISDAEDKRDPRPSLMLPFFPPHLCLPVKPGEHVWILKPDPNQENEFGYWVCRVADFIHVDDVNFTHSDRGLFQDREKAGTIDKSGTGTGNSAEGQPNEGAEFTVNGKPGFPNGLGADGKTNLSGINDYKTIYNEATANKIVTSEAVPRFTRRPGDFVIQGSNNSIIWLGEDRTSSFAEIDNDTGSPSGKSDDDLNGGAGTIDIVAGRSRFGSSDSSPADTGALTIKNTRDLEEVDKNPGVRGADVSSNPREGDLDLTRDASRIYVSMKTNGDKNFEIIDPDKTDNSPDPSQVDEAAYIINKADEIRIIARKDSDNNINGSIKIVKEGTKGEDLAAIIMHNDGTVQIDAPKIILGGNDVTEGRSSGTETPPTGYVKYSEYDKRMNEVHDILNSLFIQLSQVYGQFLAFALPQSGATAGPLPVVTLQTLAGTISGLQSQTNQDLAQIGKDIGLSKSKISQAKSDKIFGE